MKRYKWYEMGITGGINVEDPKGDLVKYEDHVWVKWAEVEELLHDIKVLKEDLKEAEELIPKSYTEICEENL